jgi:hypothetical protein
MALNRVHGAIDEFFDEKMIESACNNTELKSSGIEVRAYFFGLAH